MSYKINGSTWLDSAKDSILNSIYFDIYSLSTLPSGTRVGELAYVSDGPGPDGGLYYWNGSAWTPAGGYSGTSFGSGGVSFVSNGFKYHAFGTGSNQKFIWTGGELECLMVAGGGGGGAGRNGGGGGAGGLNVVNLYLSGGDHLVTVGAGGPGAPPFVGGSGSAGPTGNATPGGPTWISQESGNYYVVGGGGSGWTSNSPGGSGAGAHTYRPQVGQHTGPGYGNPGGNNSPTTIPPAPNQSAYIVGAGGGGSGGAGGNAPGPSTVAGRGGAGSPFPSIAGLNPAGSPTAWAWSPTWAPLGLTPNVVSYGVCGGGGGGYAPGYGSPGGGPLNGGGGPSGGGGASAFTNGSAGGAGGWFGNPNYAGGAGYPGLLIVRYPT